MEFLRGWESQFSPEKTGRIRLRQATYYRNGKLTGAGIRDENEGKTRIMATSSVSRQVVSGDLDILSDITIDLDLNNGEDPTVVHLPRGEREVSFEQIVPIDVHPIPYVFCMSRMPETPAELQALKNTINEDYDAWYSIKDPEALGRELEKAIKGWLFDRRIARHALTRRYGWVHYHDGDRPPIIADLEQGISEEAAGLLDSMKLWFEKPAKFREEREYRYAYVVESSELSTPPEYMDLELTVRAVRMFERL